MWGAPQQLQNVVDEPLSCHAISVNNQMALVLIGKQLKKKNLNIYKHSKLLSFYSKSLPYDKEVVNYSKDPEIRE